MERPLAIINPVAGRGKALKAFAALERYLHERLPGLTVEQTTEPGSATDIVQRALDRGIDRVLCFGGDGTIREVATPLCRTRVPLAIIPAGTGNDLVRTLRIPHHPLDAAKMILERPRVTDIDLVSINGTIGANIVGAGFDAEVAEFKNQRLRMFHGTLPFLFSTLWLLAGYNNAFIKVTHDHGHIAGRSLLVAAANGKSYGGGMQIAPRACPADGQLDLVYAENLAKAEILRLLPRVYKGTHLDFPGVRYLRTRHVTIEADRPLPIQADGEIVGALPATVTCLPRALTAFVGLDFHPSCD